MSRCRWQGQTVGDFVECGNSQDMMHSGRLPVLFCVSECPYLRHRQTPNISDPVRLAVLARWRFRRRTTLERAQRGAIL